MVPKIHKRGRRTIGLLYYLYGPGTFEEHTDPHLVASWDHNAPDPGRDTTATLRQLQQLLDQPVEALDTEKRPAKHVWHLSVRNSPEDRVLTDEEWGEVARRMVAAAGIDDSAHGPGCRWAAVRHAEDHIHIVATLAREDGYTPDLDHDAPRVQAQARTFEAELGLRRLNTGDGTAAKRPTSAERHKATRRGRDRTAREELRESVRRAVAGAQNENEFFERLAAEGLLIRTRAAPSGDLLGYKVALPDDRNAHDEPVFYPGARLAPDLSLPRIRERWSVGPSDSDTSRPHQSAGPAPSGPAAARRRTARAGWEAALAIGQHTYAPVEAAYIAASGEALDALAKTSAAHTRRELRDAARAFERASRSRIRAERGRDRELRRAARDLVRSGPALGRDEDGATTAMAIDMMVFLVTVVAHWHASRHHAQQAAAARQAAEHLRTAYQSAAGPPLHNLSRRGRHLPPAIQRQQEEVLRNALPLLADKVLAERSWPALAATLADAEATDHDPSALLAHVATRRELDTAESISEVLIWRLRRTANLPADAPEAPASEETAKKTEAPHPRARRPSRQRRHR